MPPHRGWGTGGTVPPGGRCPHPERRSCCQSAECRHHTGTATLERGGGRGREGGGGEGARCPAEARYQLLKSGHTGGVRTLIEERGRRRGGWGGRRGGGRRRAVVVGDGATVHGWVRLSSADPAAPADAQCCLKPRRAQLDHPHPANASRPPVSRISSCGVSVALSLFLFFF